MESLRRASTTVKFVGVFGTLLVILLMGMAYTFGETNVEFRLMPKLFLEQSKMKVVTQRLEICSGRRKADEPGELDPEELLVEKHRMLEDKKRLMEGEINTLEEESLQLREKYGEEDTYDTFLPGMRLFGEDRDKYPQYPDEDEEDDESGPLLQWGLPEKRELDELRESNKTMSDDLRRLEDEHRALVIGVSKKQMQRDADLLDCETKLHDIQEQQKTDELEHPDAEKHSLSEEELQVMQLREENRLLKESMQSEEVLGKDREILELKKQLASNVTLDQRAKVGQLEKELQHMKEASADSFSIVSKLRAERKSLEERRDEMLLKKNEEIEGLRAELITKGEKGEKGEKSEKGEKGEKGEKSEKGEEGDKGGDDEK